MYPHERSLVSRLENKPFVLVGVNSDRDRADLKKAIEKEKITWRSFWDGGSTQGPISTRWAIRGWPTLYLIDHKGILRAKYVDSPGEKVLDEKLDALVKEVEEGNKSVNEK